MSDRGPPGPMPCLTPDTIARIAEYLVLTASPTRKPDEPWDYERGNRLALQLAMELPADVWRAVRGGISGGTWGDVWDTCMAVRKHQGCDTMTRQDAIRHAPGAGKPASH
jgi:hypothetical protein